jgi:rfaE bifunctional protein nucleotidyltransferase chain/domain
MSKLKKINNKIIQTTSLLSILLKHKEEGKKIVFTNGCFDILHLGHIEYLAKAADFGDILVVGLNTDKSVKIIKGNERPINNQNARASVLASLFFVDYVVLFDENTPENLIKIIKPNILVKGKDYKLEEIAGADDVINNGGEVHTIELTEGFSTTNIINKIN